MFSVAGHEANAGCVLKASIADSPIPRKKREHLVEYPMFMVVVHFFVFKILNLHAV